MKAHISELNLHAEAQAKEYQQKVSNFNNFLKCHISYNSKLSGISYVNRALFSTFL